MEEYHAELIQIVKVIWHDNPRKSRDPVALEVLTESVRIHGVKQAIGVFVEGDGYRGLWGQGRCIAAANAGLQYIPAVIHPAPQNAADLLELALVENMAREDLNPMDLACSVKQLMEIKKMAASELAPTVGMTAAGVSRARKLLDLPVHIQEQIRKGKISAASGYQLAGVDDPHQQATLALRVADGMTRDQLIAERKREQQPPQSKGRPRSISSRLTLRLGGGRLVTFRGGAASFDDLIQTLEEILSQAKRSRTRGLSLSTFSKMCADESRR